MSNLVRFGVAIDGPLLSELDALVAERGCTRSELFRDLGRAEVARAKVPRGVSAVGTLTLVYDHHVRDLSEKLTELQHQLGNAVRATLHVHLSHDLCLEVIVIHGKSDQLRVIADRILAIRGVKHGGIEIVADLSGTEHLSTLRDHTEAHVGTATRRRGGTGRTARSATGTVQRRGGRRSDRDGHHH